MGAAGNATSRRDRWWGNLALVASLCALGSTLAIAALHGHDCVGDGCALCLAATIAHAVLAVCLGVIVARPVMCLLARLRLVHVAVMRAVALREGLVAIAGRTRVSLTPVTMGVRLLI